MGTTRSSKRRTRSDLGILFSDTSILDMQARTASSASTPIAIASDVYVSPLTTIHETIRRQFPVAAAAAATLGPESSASNIYGNDLEDEFSPSTGSTGDDPWDSLLLTNQVINADFIYRDSGMEQPLNRTDFPEQNETQSTGGSTSGTCTCRASILGDFKTPEKRKLSIGSTAVVCPRCGKRRPPEAILARRRHRGSLYVSAKELFSEPQHAEALLQTTPQLRIICTASTDMQASGHATHGNVFQRLLPVVLEHGQQLLHTTTEINGNPAMTTSATAVSSIRHHKKHIGNHMSEYKLCVLKDRANQKAAAELASLLWVMAHEMTLEDYGSLESQVFTAVFALVHAANDKERRMAGLAALDALLAAPSADEEKKAIKFANTLSNGLRAANGDFESLQATSRALGHMAMRTANVDLVESEVTRALEWLRNDRSDRRLAACLCLKELAIHAPTTFHSKTSQSSLGQGGSNEFLDHIFQAVCDPQPIVRACAADALSQCLKIIVERRHSSLTGLLCQVHFALMDGLAQDNSKKRPWHAIASAEAAQHGSLLVVSTMIACTGDFMLPRFEEVARAVLTFTESPKALIRLEVVRLIPRLASRCPRVFGRRYLEQSLEFLMLSASTPTPARVGVDIRPSAFTALGQMILALMDEETGQVIGGSILPTIKISDDPTDPDGGRIVELKQHGYIYEKLEDIFALVKSGLRAAANGDSSVLSPALHCGASLVAALGDLAKPYLSDLIDEMFKAGLSNDLIQCLQSIAQCAPEQQAVIENRMLQEVSICLAGMRGMRDSSIAKAAFGLPSDCVGGNHPGLLYPIPFNLDVVINMSDDPEVVRSLVLSLQTLAWFGGTIRKSLDVGNSVPLLPFIQTVVARYLGHPSSEVRRAAALTCCALLLPCDMTKRGRVGGHTGIIIEDVLGMLMRVAVSDPSSFVRLSVVRALDPRYDSFLCQKHHLQHLVLILQDEGLLAKAAGLRLLGRLAAINPASVLPVLRSFLSNLIVELQCGVDTGRGREEATRLLVVFLRAKSLRRLIQPVLPSLVGALPLDGSAPPRLASASLEALGELAQATGLALQPWVREVIPHVLEIMQDQSSASKQRTSLRTLGQIAGSTGYVIRPYLDYPQLLIQATDILPATKRAPWSLRREVLRTLGILGALDPDRYHASASTVRKGGAVGGAYFEETDVVENAPRTSRSGMLQAKLMKDTQPSALSARKPSFSDSMADATLSDENQPAYLVMYEQYAMCAQPISDLRPPKRMTPADEDFYPTVAIQALMRIFRDPNLAVHHGMVIQAVMFIFKSMGLGCVPFLQKVVPYMIQTIRTCESNNLRESMLKHLATLSLIVREHLRPYAADIFDVVEMFWSSRHLATIFNLISNISVGVPDAFRKFVPRLVRSLITTFDELQVADWSEEEGRSALRRDGFERLHLLLRSLSILKGVLGDYLHVLVPALLKLADSLASLGSNMPVDSSRITEPPLVELSVLVLRTISTLLESHNASSNRPAFPASEDSSFSAVASRESSEKGLPARVVQPLVRLLCHKPPKSPTVGLAVIQTLCVCAKLIGGPDWIRVYDHVVRETILGWQNTFPTVSSGTMHSQSLRGDDQVASCLAFYDDYVGDLLDQPPSRRALDRVSGHTSRNVMHIQGLNIDNAPEAYDQTMTPLNQPSTYRHRVNQVNLQRSWDVSQRASRDDWDEWMRRFAIQLLREAPSPALRSSASIAHAYQPLARELFSAAFACCWKELNEPYRANLVHALETAFVADVSPEILQTLLNLAEFMEHDPGGGLPIEIPVLADLALKCRAYAKALHYREREYSSSVVTNACVESLISINRKLDLEEAALGALKASSLGSVLTNKIPLGEKFSRYRSYDMCYSVIWTTDPRGQSSARSVDLSSKEELWLAKLGSWTEALTVYESKLKRNPDDFEALLGCMRCLGARGEWKRVLELASNNWGIMVGQDYSEFDDDQFEPVNSRSRRKASRICAQAAWRLGRWDELERFAGQLAGGRKQKSHPAQDGTLDFDGSFYNAILYIHRKEWTSAAEAIDTARKAMDGRLTALMAESYSRAYPSMVTAQTLSEMEEIIEFRKLEERACALSNRHPANRPNASEARAHLLSLWRDRLAGCRPDAEVHSSILAVRSLVLGPDDAVGDVLTLSELSRQAQRFKFAERVLLDPLEALGADLNGSSFGIGLPDSIRSPVTFPGVTSNSSYSAIISRVVVGDLRDIKKTYGPEHEQFVARLMTEAGGSQRLNIQHQLYFALVKHLWFTDRKEEAMSRLSCLCEIVDMISHFENASDSSLCVACWLELGDWKISHAATPGSFLSESLQAEALSTYKRATMLDDCGYRAWHAWALLNFRIALQKQERNDSLNDRPPPMNGDRSLRNHLVASVHGFVNAINIGSRKWSASVQQDLLNMLTCLFTYGKVQDVASVINECIGSVAIEAWLGVLPQLLARIHIKDPSIRAVLHPLLIRLGEKHPQALMYPLSVLLNSPATERKASAESLMNSLKKHSSALVEEAQMVSSELIRVAILWLEMWHEGLEEASRLYYGDNNVSGMLDLLFPLHEMLEKGAETRQEKEFLESYGSDLAKAHAFIREYARLMPGGGPNAVRGVGGNNIRSNEEAETVLSRAWDIYYIVFRRINKALPSLTKLDLSHCSPALYSARGLELGVPGTYNISGKYVKIDRVSSSVEVITSKQRPRKITMRGSDGKNYVFLLKGHEDLRQDERVMQLFGLVNALLVREPQTRKHDLKIQRYAISALSQNCGVVGWVPHADTMHSLIRDYRQAKRIPLNMENREMLRIAPDYDLLTVMQKVEVFTEALRRTTGRGNDLYEILWLKSTNSEEWLERRTRFTRSQAVMSMVGYILGLGDRHPSNLMLDKVSGRILHIDFGDCFEVAMNREKFPEKVPFRLTRMLIKAMEVSGIEGSYRSTCERTMSVLRGSRDSLVTMLEAFVYDPLISWRLVDLSPGDSMAANLSDEGGAETGAPIVSSDQEEGDGSDEGNVTQATDSVPEMRLGRQAFSRTRRRGEASSTDRSTRERSLRMFSEIQSMAADLAADSRIASIAGDRFTAHLATEGSMARSRIERSMRQREIMSLFQREDGGAHDEALNEKALKVIRRVEDKLTGTDFPDCAAEPLDVADQVQRLIVQATSSENLCQLFIGWCSFW